MSESLIYLTPFQQALSRALGYDQFERSASAAPAQPTSILEQLLAAERARSLGAPASPGAPEAPDAPGALPEGDSASNPSPSTPSPDQSLQGMLNAAQTGLAVATGPMGLATALGSLALSDMAGRTPSFNLGARGTLGALADIFGIDRGREMTEPAPVTPEEETVSDLPQADVDPGADFGVDTDEDTDVDTSPMADVDFGVDFGGPAGTDPGAGGYGATDSSENGGYGGESQFKEGGLVPLAGGGKIAIGPGGGLDDLIPTSINGRRAAALSDGEFVMPADVVSMMGDGSTNAGARRLYDLVRQIRESKTGTSRQAGPLPVGEILKRTMS